MSIDNEHTADPDPADSDHTRQCARCRKMYPADPTQHPTAIPDWWVCDGCRVALHLPSG